MYVLYNAQALMQSGDPDLRRSVLVVILVNACSVVMIIICECIMHPL